MEVALKIWRFDPDSGERELKQYERWKEEVQLLRRENQHLRLELMACRPALFRASQEVSGGQRGGGQRGRVRRQSR